MLVSPEDLRELADVSGAPFQRFVTALVLEEALGCGLKLTDIDADYRTNHPDGGCDIFHREGAEAIQRVRYPRQAVDLVNKGGDDWN